MRIRRHLCVAAVAAAALGIVGTPSAYAVCPISPETPQAGLGICYSLTHDCVNLAVYYRLPLIGSGGGPIGPYCP